MARTSKTMLHNSGESAHPCLVPYVRENAFRFLLLRMMLLVVGLLYTAFIMGFCWGRFPVCPLSGEFLFFNHKWILKFVNFFQHLLRWSYAFYSSTCWYGIWYIHSDLFILKNPCIPGINPTWSWCMILIVCCHIWFASTLLRTFEFMFTCFVWY